MINARTIAKALGGKYSNGAWTARCPAHDDRTPSLQIRDSGLKVLVHCFGGCSQLAVIDTLKSRGLWETEGGSIGLPKSLTTEISVVSQSVAPDRIARALQAWHAATQPGGTLVEVYFASRGLKL